MYFISTNENKITSKNSISGISELPNGYREITKELYDSIGVIPCSFTEVEGEIASIEYIEPISTSEPKPPTTDERLAALEETTNFLLGL